MIVPFFFAATMVVQPPAVELAPSAIIRRDLRFEDIETLTEKAKKGKTRYAGNGSGFFVSESGDVLTNHHVVDGAEEIVAVWQNTAYKMNVVASDKEHDLALLRLATVSVGLSQDIDFSIYSRPVFPAMGILQGTTCEVGDAIYVVGYPQIALQGIEAKVTKGIVSSLSGFKGQSDNFQMDAAIQGGNSGGPVVDEKGRLVGVSVATLRGGQNVNYAIKLDVVKNFLASHVPCQGKSVPIHRDKMIGRVVRSTVLVLCYESGSRPICFDDSRSDREANEARAIFAKTVIYAKVLKVRKEWAELKQLTDSLIKKYGEGVGEEIKELNSIATKELGGSLQ